MGSQEAADRLGLGRDIVRGPAWREVETWSAQGSGFDARADGPGRLEECILELFGALDVHRLEGEVELLGRRRPDLKWRSLSAVREMAMAATAGRRTTGKRWLSRIGRCLTASVEQAGIASMPVMLREQQPSE